MAGTAVALAFSMIVAVGASEQKPLLVLVESDPWLMVVGSDSPTFALYDDGHVIFRRVADGEPTLVSATLDGEKRDALVASVFGPDRTAFDALGSRYELSDTSDQPTCTIHSWVGGKRKSVSIYGDLRRDEKALAKTPPAFRRALDGIRSYANPAAKSWFPEKIEVLAWGYEYSPETPLPWPEDAGWPGIDDPTTRRRGEDLSLFLDAKELPRLRGLLRSRRETQAIEIGGKKWAVSYRIPFPHEDAWMR